MVFLDRLDKVVVDGIQHLPHIEEFSAEVKKEEIKHKIILDPRGTILVISPMNKTEAMFS